MVNNINNGQLSFFDDNCNPINPIEHLSDETIYLNKISSVKKIKEETQAPLLENFKTRNEIEEPLESLIYEMPFHFYDEKMIDPFSTKKEFSTKECIEFYLKLINKEPGYKQFWKYRETIERYFIRSFARSENVESLQKYIELIEKIPEEYRDKIIVDFDGDLDIASMINNKDHKQTTIVINNILTKKAPFDQEIMDELLDKLFESIWEKVHIDDFKLFQSEILNFFETISSVFSKYGIYSEMENLGKDRRQSYEILLDRIFDAFDIAWQGEEKISLWEHDRYRFDDWFEENYSSRYTNTLRDALWDIIEPMYFRSKKKLQNTKFMVQLFASYRQKWNNAELMLVFKRNILRLHLRDRKNHNVNNAQEKQDRTNQFKLAINWIKDIEYDRWRITYIPTQIRTSKEYFVNYPPREWKTKILEWIEDSKNLSVKIEKLEKILEEENMTERFNIDKYDNILFDKVEWHIIEVKNIFEEDEECWKVRIFELVEEASELEKIKNKTEDDFPF